MMTKCECGKQRYLNENDTSEVNQKYIKGLLTKFKVDSIEELALNYKCREHRKLQSKTVTASTENNSSKILELNVKRVENKIKLYIKVAKEIEEIFKHPPIVESDNYNNNGEKIKYYKYKEEQKLLTNNENLLLNEFGSNFIINGKFNLSIIRSVGISSGITLDIKGLISEEMLINWSKTLKDFLVKIYKQYIRVIEIEISMNVKEMI